MFEKMFAAAGLAAAMVFVPTTAYALDCENVSRPPAACGACARWWTRCCRFWVALRRRGMRPR